MYPMTSPVFQRRNEISAGSTTLSSKNLSTPHLMRSLLELEGIWIPAPTSPNFSTCSNAVTLWPLRAKAIAVARPPSPAPATMISRETFAGFAGTGPSVVWSLRRKFRLPVGYVGDCRYYQNKITTSDRVSYRVVVHFVLLGRSNVDYIEV